VGDLPRADVEVIGSELDELSALALQEADKTRRRNVEIVQEYAARPMTGKPITVRFRFLASPVELLGDGAGRVRAVKVENNQIVARDDGTLAARGTGTFDEIPAQLVFRSIGYTGQPIPGIPFDDRRGLIRNDGGRVTDESGAHLAGEYVSGWIKRGPSGVIGTNKKDSQDTVSKIIEDAAAGRLNEPISDDIEGMIESSAEHAVTWEGWLAIDAVETDVGQTSVPARPRVKLTDWEALRAAAKGVARR
jgi:ferredoxin/flavodoxin---NADP+ reductase